MAEVIYLVCAATSVVCAVLLVRGYRRSPSGLLLWSSVCFALLALNNVLLFADLVLFPGLDFGIWRNTTALGGMSLLVYGLVWDTV